MSDAAKEAEVPAPIDLSLVAWVKEAIGGRLLAYLLGCDSGRLADLMSGEAEFTDRQREVVAVFSNLRQAIPGELDAVTTTGMVRIFVMQVADGMSVARSIRNHVADQEAVPAGRDDIERSLVRLAVDVYPICLLLPDPALPKMMHDLGPRIIQTLFRHPEEAVFREAALKDAVLAAVFKINDEPPLPAVTVFRNTGSGSGLQLVMFSEMMLQAAWRKRQSDDMPLVDFVTTAIEQLRLARDALAGKPRTITARIAFTGVLLPPGRELQLTDGLVRAVTEIDRRSAPESLKGQLNGTDASGVSTTINYDGDIVLEYQMPYTVKLQPSSEEPPSTSEFELMLPPLDIEKAITRLRYSLMLAAERQYRPQLVPTWRSVDEPFNNGLMISWNDPRQGTGIMPTQLTDAETDAWAEWYDRLNTPHVAKIELALTRILRAMAERREPSDVLIDSVIAWERLFGTKEGEPTFRVTSCLAKLLANGLDERLKLKSRLSKIYTLRSDVVHGNRILERDDYALCHEALDKAIQAVRVLLTDRQDILKEPDGSRRSAALLLE